MTDHHVKEPRPVRPQARLPLPEAPTDEPVEPFARQTSNWAIAAFVVLVAILVAAFRFPPLLDYPNHYARMWLLSGGISQGMFPHVYALDWNQTFTNVGIDLIARWLGPLVGVSPVARSLLFLAIVLPPLGAIALHRRLFGCSYYWQIAMLYLAWCATLIGGFINFQIGLGMALLFAVVDHRLQSQGPLRLFAWRMIASLLLTVMHIFSLGFYLALVFGLEFSWSIEVLRSHRGIRRLCTRFAAATLACIIPPLALFLQAPELPAAGENYVFAVWNRTIPQQIANLLSAVWTYIPLVDVLLLVPIVLICSNAVRTHRIRLHAGLMITALGLLLISILSPRHILGTGWISWRFPIMAALTAMVMVCPLPQLRRRQALIMMSVLTCVALGRTAWIGFNWWQGQADALNVETVLAAVPEGSSILPLAHVPGNRPMNHRYFAWSEDTFRHLPTLATPLRHAFVPTIFTAKGKQPLKVLAPWSEIAVPEGNLSTTAVLSCADLLERDSSFTPYLIDWRKHFDFVLVVNADVPDLLAGDLMPPDLKLVADTPFAKLFQVDRAVAPAVAPTKDCLPESQ